MDNPLISVILPVFNGRPLIERALSSLAAQSFSHWEAICVDDCSSDGTHELVKAWAVRDGRFRVVRLSENSGSSAARNAGIRVARGRQLTYLDHDDEYEPDYLYNVALHHSAGDVLFFSYDIVEDDGPNAGARQLWEPARLAHGLFHEILAVPLGISHSREVWVKLGGFNERLWKSEDWDFCKRAARAGAEAVFLPLKSGTYHVRQSSLSRAPHLTGRQRAAAVANWGAGRPIFAEAGRPPADGMNVSGRLRLPSSMPGKKIAFLSPHCLIDPTSGAAVATMLGMQFLQSLGFQCWACCGSRLDKPEPIETMLARHKVPFQRTWMELGPARIAVHLARLPGFAGGNSTSLPVSIVQNDIERFAEYYAACSAQLDANRPDAVIVYGGDEHAVNVAKTAKMRDIPIVFWLHNFSYFYTAPFEMADYVIVPSEFNRQYYWDKLGLATQVLPLVVDWARVTVQKRDPRYVTFINPHSVKGLFVFARIADQLAFRRPDIRFLVMAGRSNPNWQQDTGIDLVKLPNITVWPPVADPRDFYAVTKLLLMPSLWNESFGQVAAEAMLIGIPVVASNRGALPSTFGDAGILLDIPARYTEETTDVPTAAEVEPWIDAIVRLWDDEAEYTSRLKAGLQRAEQWRPDRLAPIYREFFGSITHQPGPPIVPKDRA